MTYSPEDYIPTLAFSQFELLHNRLQNVPELQPAFELALDKPELVESVYSGYSELIRATAALPEADRETIDQATAHMLQSHGNFGTASEVSATELLEELDDEQNLLVGLITTSTERTSPYMAPALDELVRRMEGGHQLKLNGKQPSDGDEESQKVIWGHTMITNPEALLHFISCHYLERYFAVGLVAHGSQLALQKDFMLNALIDVVMLDHLNGQRFAPIYDKWRASKDTGGLGWITDDRLASYFQRKS